MERKLKGLILSCAMAIVLILVSCSTKSTTTSTPIPTSTTATNTITQTTAQPTSTTQTGIPLTSATVTATTTSTGNWWDSLGTPQYGGTMILRSNSDFVYFDPAQGEQGVSLESAYMEQLFSDNWTIGPQTFNYQLSFHPSDEEAGCLATTWAFSDPYTFIVQLRQGVYWQNISPANGREFVASDLVYHYDRMLGLGDGFTAPIPIWAANPNWKGLISVTATGNFTVTFKWNTPNPEAIFEAIQYKGADNCLECPDAVAAYGNLSNWHNAIGTGPFILTDFVDSSSATLVKNPNYWGFDERYQQNKLPYVNTISFLVIAVDTTAMAAMRAGKIDAMDGLSLISSQGMQQSNPDILQVNYPANNAVGIEPRNDKAPFTDIRVREALQMALDLPTIANTYYDGTVLPYPSSMTSIYLTGWGDPYPNWPASLQAEYAYNPTVAKQLLAAAGYPNGFNTDIVINNTGDINIIEIAQSYFAAIGVNMSIQAVSPAEFSAEVKVGHLEDALDNRPVLPLGKTAPPMVSLASLTTGNSDDVAMVNDPTFNAFYTKALAATSLIDVKQIVADANLYQAQHHFLISLLQPSGFAFYQPWFHGYSEQVGFIGSVGPTQFSFYAARFWLTAH